MAIRAPDGANKHIDYHIRIKCKVILQLLDTFSAHSAKSSRLIFYFRTIIVAVKHKLVQKSWGAQRLECPFYMKPTANLGWKDMELKINKHKRHLRQNTRYLWF